MNNQIPQVYDPLQTRAYKIKLVAGTTTLMRVQGSFFRVLDGNKSFLVSFDGNTETEISAGLAWEFPPNPITQRLFLFTSVQITALAGDDLEATVVVGQGRVLDNRVTFVAGQSALEVKNIDTVNVAQTATVNVEILRTRPFNVGGFVEVEVAAASVEPLVAAAALARHLIIQNTGALPVRLRPSGGTAGEGLVLAGDEKIKLNCSFALEVENVSGVGVAIVSVLSSGEML